MKFRVHTFQTIRVTYEVEAESADAAKQEVDENGWQYDPKETILDCAEWTADFIVDPILPNGEVD